jgi:excisionase family DNA binding protein
MQALSWIQMNKSFYSTSEVASVFQISRVTVFRWVQEGNIKAYKVGKHLKIPSSEIERLLKKFGLPEDSFTEIINIPNP